ncbi:dolichol monophosphate mannose synthase [Salmonella enterica]|uniref:Dolichol monophosphate mannose synthase n=1 Tax=Salmonella enterica subsp. enterica serovar Macclesfield str. S-1643 TaxID=1242107 RepID=A0A241PXR0_SALET|nr:dolichol monophosphate mannose synthase [Salmonella enterica subsp. enterica serovar Macclesfield str. S-1643]EAA5488389.1 dolichol monophosphate mannose synthase [Salmonella enterica subsp. enterica serovar Kouka]EAC0474184.1 dolichol monophosphate mannose synthase [Salmonella enterica subsp. enterica serovar Tornow]EDV1507080.1 dolichol monophosphate mannose synthase [Salmonella enterica subsp. salamae]EEI9683977.1 dolichol monophosphate mannose synthase [Salmonella enterica]EGZ3978336.1 
MKRQIIQYMRGKSEGCGTAEIAYALKLSSYQARYYLQQLEKEKKVTRTPLRRGARTIWTVSN